MPRCGLNSIGTRKEGRRAGRGSRMRFSPPAFLLLGLTVLAIGMSVIFGLVTF